MTTSNHAVLFTKQTCLPCTKTKDHLSEILRDQPGLGRYVSVLQKENHSALVEAYDLNLYPTLLVVYSLGEELARITGGQAVRDDIKGILTTLRALDK